MDNEINNENETPNLDGQPNKRRRKKSMVWEHFTIETIDADSTRAFCKQCHKSFAYITGSKLAGTSHLKRHIALGICPVSRHNQEKNNQLSLPYPTANGNGSVNASEPPTKRRKANRGSASTYFEQEHCNYEIAKMIIQHDYPLNIVEHSGFVDFLQLLQPEFNAASINAIQEQIVGIYLREKQNILNILDDIPGRISLTLDLRTSDQSLGYVYLMGHFVDCNWKLHRRVLNVIMVPFPDSEFAFNHAVAGCLTDWGFENKLFTLTLDQSFASEAVRVNLRGLLSIKNHLLLDGQLIIGSCYARVLSSLALDALGSIRETIEKVRQSVKYVKTSEAHEEKFFELKQQLQVPSTKSLFIDDETKWNTTYSMLIAAAELKEVFSCLDTSDPDYKATPSMDEWRQVEILCTFLKLLYDAASILNSPVYPTANTFFHEVWKIQLELMHAATSEDIFISGLTRPLQEKFDRYWKDCNLLLAVAVVMDPRFKMKLVEFSFARIYGEDAETWIRTVDEGLHELFLEYFVQALPPPTFVDGPSDSVEEAELSHEDCLLSNGDGLSDFDVYISEITSNQQMKSELDQYLEESLLPRVQDFDVLGWWKVNRSKYPTLSKMASDILSIPLSTVAPDSVFDTAIKKLDRYQSSLKPMILEALVCSKDWLRYGSSEFQPGIPTGLFRFEG